MTTPPPPPPLPPQVRVGVGVFVLASSQEPRSNPKFIVGKRLGSHGAGKYALPGGHLEFGESLETCAAREVLEETGLTIRGAQFLTATNDYMPAENKHYITMFMACVRDHDSSEPQTLEPDKCAGWQWTDWNELVKLENKDTNGQESEWTLFEPMLNLIRQQSGAIPTIGDI